MQRGPAKHVLTPDNLVHGCLLVHQGAHGNALLSKSAAGQGSAHSSQQVQKGML